MLRKTSYWKKTAFKPIIRGTVVLSTAMLLAVGCKVGPDYIGPPTPKVQNNWSEKTIEDRTSNVQDAQIHNELPALDDWWVVFNDPTMNLILKTVNEQNLDIRIAAQRIYQATMDVQKVRGDLFPKIGTTFSYMRSMLPGSGENKHNYSSSWDLDFGSTSASWEVDVFGQIRRYVESYNYAWQATIEDRNNVKILLLAETARTYIEARLNQEKERIARADIRDLETYLEKIRARHDAGADCNVELVQAQANLASVKASLPTIQTSYMECTTRLASLMGATPERVEELLLQDEGYIPNVPDALAVGIPADMLRRRPDIRALERRIAQQTALIGVQQAELYPKFYVDGVFGLQSANLEDLFNTRSMTATIMPRLSWRIFEFGRIRSTIAKQTSVTEEMRLEYQQAVLEAGEEVNNAITDYVKLQDRYDEQLEAVRNYDEALKLSLALYEAGKREYMVVLDSQRYLLANRQTLATVHAGLACSVVSLYTALGGGWQVDPQAASSLTPELLRSDFVPDGALHLSMPGEGVNQLGPASGRGLPQEVLESSEQRNDRSYELPPEGQTGKATRKNKNRLTGAAPVTKKTRNTAPALPPVDEEDDLSVYPEPSRPQSVIQKPASQVSSDEELSSADPLLAGLTDK